MKTLAAFLAVSLAAAPLITSADEPPPVSGSKVVKLHAQNGSHEYGTVAIKPRGDSSDVEIHVVGSPPGVSQPAHIHMGTCATLDPTPKYPLQPVLDGVSETIVKVPLATLIAMPMAVNIHKSADDLKDYVACADLK